MENFSKYLGVLVSNILLREPDVVLRIARLENGFQVKVQKQIPLTDRTATYQMTVPDQQMIQATPIYLEIAPQKDADRALASIRSCITSYKPN